VRTVREAIGGKDDLREIVAQARKALAQQLWRSVVDDAECTCEDGDPCPECQAMGALGLGRWLGAKDAERRLPSAVGIDDEVKVKA
jgi:hypothetical protein